MHTPPSVEDEPLTAWPPPQTAMSRPFALLQMMIFETSSADVGNATTLWH